MNTYQRGNRDGLLNAAAEYSEKAEKYRLEANKMEGEPDFRRNDPVHLHSYGKCHDAYVVAINTTKRLRQLAEACPEDPEERRRVRGSCTYVIMLDDLIDFPAHSENPTEQNNE